MSTTLISSQGLSRLLTSAHLWLSTKIPKPAVLRPAVEVSLLPLPFLQQHDSSLIAYCLPFHSSADKPPAVWAFCKWARPALGPGVLLTTKVVRSGHAPSADSEYIGNDGARCIHLLSYPCSREMQSKRKRVRWCWMMLIEIPRITGKPEKGHRNATYLGR